jgi:hypothetical protein
MQQFEHRTFNVERRMWKALQASPPASTRQDDPTGRFVFIINGRMHFNGYSKKYFRRIVNIRTRVVLTSGGLEPVLDDGIQGHSVFTKAFLDVLEKNNGILEGTRLFNELRRPVILNAPQTPEYSNMFYAGHEGGDFLFVRQKTND